MKRAFTLIELLVVVLIIGILAAIALPKYEKSVWKSRATQLLISARSLSDAQKVYYLANGKYASKFGDLDIAFDNLNPATSSSLSLGISSTDAVRYNNEFELVVNVAIGNPNFAFSTGMFKTGPYKGGGFTFSHDNFSSNLQNKIYCIESISHVKTPGIFCAQLMGTSATAAVTVFSTRFYEMS